MKEIILIEIISFASFLYSIITLFYSFTSINQMILLFLWTVITSTFYAINKDKSITYKFSILVLFLPLLYFKGTGAIYFIVITGILMSLYAQLSVSKGNHFDYVEKFKLTFLIYIIAILNRSLLGIMSGSLSYAAPFLILYVLTAITLTRLIRHIEFNDDLKSLRRLNIKYLITIGIVFITTRVEQIRNFIILGFKKFVDIVLLIVFYPLYWITSFIKVDITDPEIIEETEIIFEDMNMNDLARYMYGDVINKIEAIDFTILKRIIGFLLILLLMYLVYRLLMKRINRYDEYLDYTEEREYIEKPKKKKRNIFQNLIYPRDIGGQIRYYYRKYLKKLDKSEIEIADSDTSLDINEKAKGEFGKEIVGIRNIYIESRYGEKEGDKDSVKEIKSFYKKL